MSWYQLLDILKLADEEFKFYASQPPLSCPRCGEPWSVAPTAWSADAGSTELFCKFDGFHYPDDYVRPQPL